MAWRLAAARGGGGGFKQDLRSYTSLLFLTPPFRRLNPYPENILYFRMDANFECAKGSSFKKMFRNIFQSQDTFAQHRRENSQIINIIIHSISMYVCISMYNQPTLASLQWLGFNVTSFGLLCQPSCSCTFPVGRCTLLYVSCRSLFRNHMRFFA